MAVHCLLGGPANPFERAAFQAALPTLFPLQGFVLGRVTERLGGGKSARVYRSLMADGPLARTRAGAPARASHPKQR